MSLVVVLKFVSVTLLKTSNLTKEMYHISIHNLTTSVFMLHPKGITQRCAQVLMQESSCKSRCHHVPSNTGTNLLSSVQNENSEQTMQIKFYLCKFIRT